MPWWAWLIGGALLAVIELTAADAAFYFIFIGVAAFLVGLLQLTGAELALWEQWLLFASFAILSMVLFREKLYKKLRGNLPGFDSTMNGTVVEISEDVPAGGDTHVRLHGSRWRAHNVGQVAIASGGHGRVVGTAGTALNIVAAGGDADEQPVARES